MRVRDLIEILENCDPNAEVRLATQPQYPLESAIEGVVTRADFQEDDGRSGARATDVLLLEGTQLGYGSRAAWHAGRC